MQGVISEDQLIEQELRLITSLLGRTPTKDEFEDFLISQCRLGEAINSLLTSIKEEK